MSGPTIAGSVLAVVVVHERAWSEVRAAGTLAAWLEPSAAEAAGRKLALTKLLVYDNSATPVARPAHGHGVLYEHAPGNGGTRAAYERAVAIAENDGIEWILLLDQDTELPPAYLQVASAALQGTSVALVPTLVSNGRVVSPGRFTRLGRVVPLARPESLAPAGRGTVAAAARDAGPMLAPMASAALIRSSALAVVRELPSELWLDYVDHALFHRLQQRGHRIGSIALGLRHEASISRVAEIPLERLASIWRAERVFVERFGRLASAARSLRLLWRVARLAVLHPARAGDAWRARRALRRSRHAAQPAARA